MCSLTDGEKDVFKHLHPQDKLEMSVSREDNQFLNLNIDIFNHSTEYNSKSKLEQLKQVLFENRELESDFVMLVSSPLSTVNLDSVSRLKAAIPKTAAFFAFCYPCASETSRKRAHIAQDRKSGHAMAKSTSLPLRSKTGWEDGSLAAASPVSPLAAASPASPVNAHSDPASATVKRYDRPPLLGRGDTEKRLSNNDSGLRSHMIQSTRSFSFHQIPQIGLDYNDPLVRWLLEGAFLYFNSTYDVVAINALCAEDLHTSSTAAEAQIGRASCRERV